MADQELAKEDTLNLPVMLYPGVEYPVLTLIIVNWLSYSIRPEMFVGNCRNAMSKNYRHCAHIGLQTQIKKPGISHMPGFLRQLNRSDYSPANEALITSANLANTAARAR